MGRYSERHSGGRRCARCREKCLPVRPGRRIIRAWRTMCAHGFLTGAFLLNAAGAEAGTLQTIAGFHDTMDTEESEYVAVNTGSGHGTDSTGNHAVRDSLGSATVTAWRRTGTPPDSIPRERLNTVQNTAEAIKVFGGLQIKDYGGVGGLKTVNVRSLGSEHTGVFMDGIQIGNAQNAQVDLGRFSTEDIGRIELYNGQGASMLAGAKDRSTAASIYLYTLRPSFADGEKFHGTARLKAGSFGTVSPYFRWEQRLGKRISASASIEYLRATGKYRFRCRKEVLTDGGQLTGYDTTMIRSNSDIQALRAEGNIFGTLDRGEWSFKIYYYGSERGLPGAVVRHPETLSQASDRQEDGNFFVQGNLKKEISGKYSFRIAGKYANDRMRYHTDPLKDPSAMPVDDSYRQQEAWLSLSHLVRLMPWWALSAATDVQANILDSGKNGFVFPRRAGFWGSLFTVFDFGRLYIEAGAVYTLAADFYRNSSGTAARGERDGHTGYSGSAARELRDAVSPSLIIRYTPSRPAGLSLSGFVKRSYRMPTFNDLYYVNFGNVSLKPEDAMQYDLRIDYGVSPVRNWTLSAKAEGYYNNVHDKIIAVPTSSQFRWTMYNIGLTRTIGAEGTFGWEYRSAIKAKPIRGNNGRTTPGLEFCTGMTARYTFQRAMDVSSPGKSTYMGQIPYIPRHSISITAFAAYGGWRMDYTFIYTGVRYSSSSNLPSTMMQPWSTHDISLSRNFAAGLGLQISVCNILNRQYEIVPNYPMPGCNILASVSYEF